MIAINLYPVSAKRDDLCARSGEFLDFFRRQCHVTKGKPPVDLDQCASGAPAFVATRCVGGGGEAGVDAREPLRGEDRQPGGATDSGPVSQEFGEFARIEFQPGGSRLISQTCKDRKLGTETVEEVTNSGSQSSEPCGAT